MSECDCGKLLIDLEWRELAHDEDRTVCSCGQIHYRDAYDKHEPNYYEGF